MDMNADDPRNNCKMKEACECLARNAAPNRTTLRMFCEQWLEPEKQIAELHQQSIKNWQRLPDQVRLPCLDFLRRCVPVALLEGWRDQKARGVAIGSNRIRFHFDEGMVIRNALRKVHRDDFLPTGNWDDYYYGAVDDLASVPQPQRVTLPDADDSCEFCGADPGALHKNDCPKLRAKLPPYIPAKEFPDKVPVVRADAECHHHRLTLECSICKRLAAAVERAIPPGVYYNCHHENFYTFDQRGMGDAFYNSWIDCKHLFPTHSPIEPDYFMSPDDDVQQREKGAP